MMVALRSLSSSLFSPPPNHFNPKTRTLVISASKSRGRRNRKSTQNKDEEEAVGGMGRAVFTALTSNPPRKTDPIIVQPSSSSNPKRSQGSSTPLKGADVLLALQRATNQLGRNTKSKKKRRDRVEERKGEDENYLEDVRPINVKSDWGSRLDEMERLLQELQGL